MKKNDIIVGVGILFFAILLFIAITIFNNKNSNNTTDYFSKTHIFIYLGSSDEPYKVLPVGVEEEITIDQGNNVRNVIKVDKEGVYMHSSTCKNQNCINQGKIKWGDNKERPLGNWIICLPNKVSINVK